MYAVQRKYQDDIEWKFIYDYNEGGYIIPLIFKFKNAAECVRSSYEGISNRVAYRVVLVDVKVF